MICGCTSTQKFRGIIPKLKPAIVLAIILFYVHILVVENNENGWKSQRQYCYAESGTCDTPNTSYGVDSSNNCYKVTITGSHKACVSDSYMSSCMAANGYTYTDSVLLAEYGSTPVSTYFLHSTAIAVIGCVVLVFSVLFDEKLKFTDFAFLGQEEGAFYRPDVLSMAHVTSVLELVIVCLMIWSAATFNLMQPAVCADNAAISTTITPDHGESPRHPPPPHGGDGGGSSSGGDGSTSTGGSSSTRDGGGTTRNVCSEITNCGADVRSVVQPVDAGARYYTVFVVLLLVAFVVAVLLRLLVGKTESRVFSESELPELLVSNEIENMQLQLDELQRPSATSSGSNRSSAQTLAIGVTSTTVSATSTATVPVSGSIVSGTLGATGVIVPAMARRASSSSSRSSSSRSNGTVNSTNTGTVSSSSRSRRNSAARANLNEFAETLCARQTLVRKWDYFEVNEIRADTSLRNAVSNQGECAICLAALVPSSEEEEWDNPVVIRVPCGHWFHKDCLTGWMVSGKSKNTKIQNNTCPVCRANLAAGRQ